jgi:DNA-binding MarR family transcriptional regulator
MSSAGEARGHEPGAPRGYEPGAPRGYEPGEPLGYEPGEPLGYGLREPRGYELPLRLLAAFRLIIDELHAELGRQGHPHMRPMHGFVFQAIGLEGTTAVELGRRLGISKQAAGKTIDNLAVLGYVRRQPDPGDHRQKIVTLTERGFDALGRSAAIFDVLRAGWAARLGEERLAQLEAGLRELTGNAEFPLDIASWLGRD